MIKRYGGYLRKSRADLDLEANGILDTLKRHKDILLKTAQSMNIIIDEWFEEVVSGETIEARPEIQKMLSKVEQGYFEGIFVVDIDRLARGDTADQSRILKCFSFSSTKIITPTKIYDPNNDSDEEYFEFGLFMSRREYKIINKRLNRGRLSSVNEGKFVGSTTPYGYTKEKLKGQKGYKLIPLEEEAKVIKLIFQKASDGDGTQTIANYLNKLGVKPRKNDTWSYSTIISIIQNPTYYGMIKWNHRKTEKRMVNGVVYKSRPKHSDYILVQGLHEPLITKEIYDKANKLRTQKCGKSVRKDNEVHNPLMGLVKCELCGRTMQRRNYRSGHIDGLVCPKPHCQTCGSHLYLVENKIVESLKDILNEYNSIIENYDNSTNKEEVPVTNDDTLEIISKEISKLNSQLNKAYDLLEQGIYDNDTFVERSKTLKEKISSLQKEKEKFNIPTTKNKIDKIKEIIPNIQNVIKNYNNELSPEEKNQLLTSIIESISYSKFKKGKGHEDEFALKIKIKIC